MIPFIEQELKLDLLKRPRRNRQSGAIRSLVTETYLKPQDLVAPLFVIEGNKFRQNIPSMPGVDRLSLDLLLEEVTTLFNLGIRAIDLFPVIPKELRDPEGSIAYHQSNILWKAVQAIKKEIPEMCVMVDIALDPYTSHGHDGLVNEQGQILNDETVEALGRLSIVAAESGVDVVAPSDMMDGRVEYIRRMLDREGFQHVSILSYAAKYASALYGPFRDALSSGPKFGDKKTYQMDPANVREALLECKLDEEEGADMLLVKPALMYLDVIAKIRQQTHLPIAAYHVSGEYAMVKAAAEKGWINGQKVMYESLLSIKRAGADFILTYAAKEIAHLLP